MLSMCLTHTSSPQDCSDVCGSEFLGSVALPGAWEDMTLPLHFRLEYDRLPEVHSRLCPSRRTRLKRNLTFELQTHEQALKHWLNGVIEGISKSRRSW